MDNIGYCTYKRARGKMLSKLFRNLTANKQFLYRRNRLCKFNIAQICPVTVYNTVTMLWQLYLTKTNRHKFFTKIKKEQIYVIATL